MNAPDKAIDIETIQAQDAAHFLHPFTDFKDLASRGSKVIVKAEGFTCGTQKATKCWMP